MDIVQSANTDHLLRDLDLLKDDALKAAATATQAPDCGLSDLCDALRWVAIEGTVQAITTITGAWSPRGLLLTATATMATSGVRIVEHVPLALTQGGPRLECISRDSNTTTTSLITRWSTSHVLISPLRLRQATLRNIYTAREKAPSIDTETAPKMRNQKVTQ